ncbi:hypothetical protein GAU_1797 [Gemmatimonas aurantiaca T-27]|uniref:DUF7448 domain-containing protein n=1 Tax=Gemmatimonas aurantiaca (strain DSM 14586 / JCM 11422 / NBRC 100505 / T-27) TaxID=379066 RepID=C1A414_GEMAT|nr:hypothetical protein [Gemmatimonas aurantiaca]BAH38839.1 hypothetical protein GAU_1797 [Gemmatimonas aurantiaca T-27]
MSYGDAWSNRCPFSTLLGKTVTHISGLEAGSDRVVFDCADGTQFTMAHQQDCCESVSIDDVVGHAADLIGSPLTMADEVDYDGQRQSQYDESFTWTFYKLATIKGYVDIRWYGTSNGYYSESVDFWQSGGVTP